MTEDNKKIEALNREELRDRLLVIQERINSYIRAGRKNFEFAMAMDKQKELIEERLLELEDWSTEKPSGGGRIHVETPSNE